MQTSTPQATHAPAHAVSNDVPPLDTMKIDGRLIKAGADKGFAFNPGEVFRDPPSPATPPRSQVATSRTPTPATATVQAPQRQPEPPAALRAMQPDDVVRHDTRNREVQAKADRDYRPMQAGYRALGLTREQENAVDEYVGYTYKPINKALRGEERMTDEHRAQVRLIEAAIDRSPPTDRNMVLTRLQKNFDPNWEPGGEKMIESFWSASLAPEPAFKPEPGGVAFEIFVPMGSRGVLAGFNYPEHEVLFNHGAAFRVHRVTETTYGFGGTTRRIKTYQVEYIGPVE